MSNVLLTLTNVDRNGLNSRPELYLTLPGPSNVVAFYVSGPAGSGYTEREYDYPCASIVQLSEVSYKFTSPRLALDGLWYFECNTDYGASSHPVRHRVNQVGSSLLLSDVTEWTEEISAPPLPFDLPMEI